MIEIITFVWCFTFVRKMVESTNLKMLQKPLGIKKSNTINNDKSIDFLNRYHPVDKMSRNFFKVTPLFLTILT